MPDHHIHRVSWSVEDQEYVGTCAEFPGLSHLDATKAVALRGIEQLVAFAVDDMRPVAAGKLDSAKNTA